MRKLAPACAILCVSTYAPVAGAAAQQPGTAATQPGGVPSEGPEDVDRAPVGDQMAPLPGSGVDPSAPGGPAALEEETPATVTTGPLSAWGDTIEQANMVLSRPRPGLDPQGIRLGTFTLLPTLAVNAGYDSNIFATQNGRVGSPVIAINPSLQLSRVAPGSSLVFTGNGLIQRYTDASRANYEQFGFKGDGAFDLSSALAVRGGAHYNRQAEPRGTAGDVAPTGNPSIYYNPGANLEMLAGTGPLQLSLGGTYDHFNYNSLTINGVRQSQAVRDRDTYSVSGQAGIEVGPGILTFVSGTYDRQHYDHSGGSDPGALIANSRGYSVLGGVDLRLTKLVRGRIGVGYLWRDYSLGFAKLSGLNYDASIVWNVTTLFALTVKAAKQIEESPSVGISGIIANTFSIAGDWELTRKILVSAKLDYAREKYRAISRIDHRVEPSIMVHYLAGRNMSFDVGYSYRRQHGDSALARRYSQNVIMAGITLQK
jgi:hypothetical protein